MRFALTLKVGHDKEPYDALNHSYVSFFERLDIAPVLVPNAIGDPCSYVNSLGVQGIILTGGNDISPGLYGQDPLTCRNVSAVRDRVESNLLQMAIEKSLPVLGICRGMHFINVFFGGSLIQDVRAEVGEEVDHVGHSHTNEIVDLAIGGLLGVTELVVNSFHNQGVVAHSLAPTLRVFAVSKGDALIEGVLHPAYPVLGVQWHPERPGSSAEYDLRLIQGFLRGEFWKGQ
jgi:gamma-glutamyl-gamma-aminobutyrate hydrolase PuuD